MKTLRLSLLFLILFLLIPLISKAQIGALSYYQLKGPVKSVEFKVNNDIVEIDIADAWTLGYHFITSINFDKFGRVDEPWNEAYSYDNLGRLKGVTWEKDIDDDAMFVPQRALYWAGDFIYDKDGRLVSYSESLGFDMDQVVRLTYSASGDVIKYSNDYHETSYTVIKKDVYGNWIERKNSAGEIERRVITYY